MPNPVVHFEIPANDVQRAKAFYEKTFGWEIQYMPDYDYFWVKAKSDGVGIDGGMMKRKDPRQPFMNYLTVASIDAMLAKVVANGGKVALPKTPMGMGALAAFIDPEGNIVGLHEEGKKPAAKTAATAKKAPMKETSAKKAAKGKR